MEITGSNTIDYMGALSDLDDIGKDATSGLPRGLASDGEYIYQAMGEGTALYIYKGRESRHYNLNGDLSLRWEWCPIVYVNGIMCNDICVQQVTQQKKYLWFGYRNSTNEYQTAYIILSDNPTSDANARFCASGLVKMSYTYGTNPYWDKIIQSVVLETKGCAAGITVRPYYWKNTDTSATALTAALTTNGIFRTHFAAAITGQRFMFELDLATNDSTKTPEVYMIQIMGYEIPTTIKTHECTYLVGESPTTLASGTVTALRACRTATNLIKLARLDLGETITGATYVWVRMEAGYPVEVPIVYEKNRQYEWGMKCVWTEIPFSVT
jgi:hypothetical protein